MRNPQQVFLWPLNLHGKCFASVNSSFFHLISSKRCKTEWNVRKLVQGCRLRVWIIYLITWCSLYFSSPVYLFIAYLYANIILQIFICLQSMIMFGEKGFYIYLPRIFIEGSPFFVVNSHLKLHFVLSGNVRLAAFSGFPAWRRPFYSSTFVIDVKPLAIIWTYWLLSMEVCQDTCNWDFQWTQGFFKAGYIWWWILAYKIL